MTHVKKTVNIVKYDGFEIPLPGLAHKFYAMRFPDADVIWLPHKNKLVFLSLWAARQMCPETAFYDHQWKRGLGGGFMSFLGMGNTILSLSGEAYRQEREVVNPSFEDKSVRALQPRYEQIAAKYLGNGQITSVNSDEMSVEFMLTTLGMKYDPQVVKWGVEIFQLGRVGVDEVVTAYGKEMFRAKSGREMPVTSYIKESQISHTPRPIDPRQLELAKCCLSNICADETVSPSFYMQMLQMSLHEQIKWFVMLMRATSTMQGLLGLAIWEAGRHPNSVPENTDAGQLPKQWLKVLVKKHVGVPFISHFNVAERVVNDLYTVNGETVTIPANCHMDFALEQMIIRGNISALFGMKPMRCLNEHGVGYMLLAVAKAVKSSGRHNFRVKPEGGSQKLMAGLGLLSPKFDYGITGALLTMRSTIQFD